MEDVGTIVASAADSPVWHGAPNKAFRLSQRYVRRAATRLAARRQTAAGALSVDDVAAESLTSVVVDRLRTRHGVRLREADMVGFRDLVTHRYESAFPDATHGSAVNRAARNDESDAELLAVSESSVRRAAERISTADQPDEAELAGAPVRLVVHEMLLSRLGGLMHEQERVQVFPDELVRFTRLVRRVLVGMASGNPWPSALGPVYWLSDACRLLGDVGPHELRRRGRRRELVMLETSDGHQVFPEFQFRAGALVPGLDRVLGEFDDPDPDLMWTIATWLRRPLGSLGDASVMAVLHEGDPERVDAAVLAARSTWFRWSH